MLHSNPNTQLLNRLRKIADSKDVISYKDYIQEVLFAPEIGYYTRLAERVGRNEKTDFYTAESLGNIFGELVVGAARKILGDEECSKAQFIEIGAEPNRGIIQNIKERKSIFAGDKVIRVGEEIRISHNAIVFGNELLDAQAFHRLIYINGKWNELGVRIDKKGLREELMPELSTEVKKVINELPNESQEGYILDLPLGAENLLKKIVEQDWTGMIVLFDYGFLWEDLIHNHPEGTARAYYKHKQHNDLLSHVGEQDITCHLCWDRLSKILEENGFQKPQLQRQESFFVHHAKEVVEKIICKVSKEELNYDKQTLLELIHPTHMGHKFQVLWAKRCKNRERGI